MLSGLVLLLAPGTWHLAPAFAQQPQTSDVSNTQPVYAVNAKYVNGVAPGYWPTATNGLTLNLSAGTAFCGGAVVTYAGGTLTMAGSATNYVYLSTASSCAPASNTTGFTTSTIPIATVVTSSSAITSITDVRTPFFAGGGGTISDTSVTGTTTGATLAVGSSGLKENVAFLDASAMAGSTFDAKVNACIALLPSTGGTCDAWGLYSAQSMVSSIVIGSDTKPVRLILPPGTITRSSGAEFKYFAGSVVEGQGDYGWPTVIKGTGSDATFAYGGSGTPWGVHIRNLAIDDTTAGSVGIDFTYNQSSTVENVLIQADTPLVMGSGPYGCTCYNQFWNLNAMGISYGVKLNAGSNSNEFYGGVQEAAKPSGVGIYIAGVANHFYSPDIEGTGIAAEIYGSDNSLEHGYYEANTNPPTFELNAMGNMLWGGAGLTFADSSGNLSNYVFAPDGQWSPSFGVGARLIFGYGGLDECGSPINYMAGCQGQWSIIADYSQYTGITEVLYGGGLGKIGYFGHSPLISGYMTNYGGENFNGSLSVTALGTPSPPSLSCPSSGTGTTYTYYLAAHDFHGGVTLPSSAATIQCPNAPSATYPVRIIPPQGQITSVSINTAGTGYAVGDQIGVVAQWPKVVNPATLTVASISGGGSTGPVTGLTFVSQGQGYIPSNYAPPYYAPTVTNGAGTGLTLNTTVLAQLDGVSSWDILAGDTAHSIYTNAECGSVNPICQDTGQSHASYSSPIRDKTGDGSISGNLTVKGAINNGIATTTNNDNRGKITLSSGTGSYTFTQGPGAAGVWTTAPVCIIQDDTTMANIATSTKTVSASTLTITGSVGTGDTYSYICWPGN